MKKAPIPPFPYPSIPVALFVVSFMPITTTAHQVEIVERFTIDEDELVYDFWANDPVNFTQPIEEKGFFVRRWQPDIELRINECEIYSKPGE